MAVGDYSCSPNFKRARFTEIDSMDSQASQAKFATVKEELGRDVKVFDTIKTVTPQPKNDDDEVDDYYELTAADYYRMTSTKKEDKFLKTKKIRDAEEAARRSRITKTTIRVRFPDGITLEASFHPSEKFQSLVDFIKKVITRPELPFYLYTTPPREVIKDLSKDFFSASFIPGANVYFAYDTKGDDAPLGPFLKEDILLLKDLEPATVPAKTDERESTPEPVTVAPQPVVTERRSSDKKSVKPKWLKM